ncbi:hypothetical protein ACEQ8H_003511 [Pleosporales sp. CAS-2024a]
MTAPTIYQTLSAPKHQTAKQWLQRCLRRLPSIEPSSDRKEGGVLEAASLQRPKTAPSSSASTETNSIPTVPLVPTNVQCRHSDSAQPRPSFPGLNPAVERNINAWLDASSTPSPPLMGGVTYWRKATVANVKDSVGIQHAMPIVQAPGCSRPSTLNSQQAKSFRKRAKKEQVQMPLAPNDSRRPRCQEQAKKRVDSTPVLSVAYEATDEDTPPMHMTRRRSLHKPSIQKVPFQFSMPPETRPSSEVALLGQSTCRYNSPSSTRTYATEGSIDRHMDALLACSTASGHSTQASSLGAAMHGQDSMDDLSDPPTSYLGPRPPACNSRPASIVTTSSFGCIDGMSPAQRQISQQRAALQKGIKGRLKRLAQNLSGAP